MKPTFTATISAGNRTYAARSRDGVNFRMRRGVDGTFHDARRDASGAFVADFTEDASFPVGLLDALRAAFAKHEAVLAHWDKFIERLGAGESLARLNKSMPLPAELA